jgi:hypothetical protein
MKRFHLAAVACLAALVLIAAAVAQVPLRPKLPRLPGQKNAEGDRDELFRTFNAAERVFRAKLDGVRFGPVGRSMPPVYSVTLRFGKQKMLRGRPPEGGEYRYTRRSAQRPVFAAGREHLVAVASVGGDGNAGALQQVKAIIEATPENRSLVRKAVALPVGWRLADDKILCPWDGLGEKAWPKNLLRLDPKYQCAKTGRPALKAGEAVKLTVEQVIPEKVHKYRNPYGDGRFKITVTNTTDEAVQVPALLADGEKVLWADSLVVVQGGKTHLLPGAGKLHAGCKPLILKPEAKVTAVIDTLTLKDVDWPRGGSRVRFTFGLGEHARTNFFYYHSKRHDKLREKSRKAAEADRS